MNRVFRTAATLIGTVALVAGAAASSTAATWRSSYAVADGVRGVVGATPRTDVAALDLAGENDLRSFWASYGVSEDVQEQLLSSLDRGQRWESLGGSHPISSTEYSTTSLQVVVDTYSDGSISVTEMEIPVNSAGTNSVTPAGEIAPMQMSQCVQTNYSTYRDYNNCFVSNNVGIAGASFRARYRVYYSGYSTITSVWSPSRWYIGVTATEPVVKITRSKSTSSLPATARLSFTATLMLSIPASWTCWLDLYVYSSGAHDTQSFF